MAKLYSISKLREIHSKKEALNGVTYQTEDNRIDGTRYFIGNSEGRLDEITDVTLIEDNTTTIAEIKADIEDLLRVIEDLENTGNDYHSGYSKINSGDTVTIEENKQMTNWNRLEIDGTLIIDGELILK